MAAGIRSAAAVAVAVGLLAVGCSSASDNTGRGASTLDTTASGELKLDWILDQPADPRIGGKMAFGLNAETDGWNVTSSRWSGSAYIVGSTIFDPLAAYDTDYEPQPYLAESIASNDDFTVWTIGLRSGVNFHDGTAVNADAVVENLKAHQVSPLTAPTMDYIVEEGITKVDDLTVQIEMRLPWSTFPHLLTVQPGYIMSPNMMAAENGGSRKPVGSGPFSFESWVPDSALKVKKNPSYWRDGLPRLDDIEFQVIKDVQARGRALETGQIDIMESGDARQIARFAGMAASGKYQMYGDDNAENSETFIALNVTKPPFDDPLARRILAHGVDTAALSQAAYDGFFPPANSMFAPNSPYYDAEAGYPEFDLEEATRLHEEYKAKNGGRPLAFSANITPTPEIQNIAQTLQQQANLAGIEVKLNTMDQPKLIVDAVSRNYEATGFILFGSPTPDRDSVFFMNEPEGSFLNITGIDNPRITEAMQAARATDDRAVQIEQYKILQREMAIDLNFIWLVHNLAAVVFQPNVFGVADWTLPDGTAGGRAVTPFLAEAWLQ